MSEMNPDLVRDGVAYVDEWLAYQQERRDLPGVVVGIRHGEAMLLLKGYGFANLERQTLMSPERIFRIASHSKTFTATAVMQLVERGNLRLDDRLADYVPWLRDVDALVRVTVRQALNHTTGIVRDGNASDYWQLDGNFPDDAALRRFVEHGGAILDPNESFKYSNIAYGLLGMVIAAASGQSYADYVVEHIVTPLGLTDTGPDTDARVRDRLATGYTARRFGLAQRPIPDVSTGALAAATGFYATAADLCRYAAAHCFGDTSLLSDASKREMQQPYWKVAHAEMHYGLGFAVYEIGKRRFIGHGGGFPGHATQTLIDPVNRLVITVLTNEIAGPASLFAHGAAHIINLALQQSASGAGSARRDRYTGRFASLWGVTDIAAFGDTLVMLSPEAENPARLVGRLAIEDDDTLTITDSSGTGSPGETIRYVRGADGNVAKVVVGGASAYPVAAYRERIQARFG